ncbi:Proline porter II [Piscirickettsia salmonis]|uniref:MFS transporter n=1 Tax=Piscirickettsia salmonis TaxID=1238 RepID=UPI0012BAC99A|nr:MFS transporter [Piscirickettsia salmonis]QGP55506.1 Proline porter II [Piscirickettsia salmonis]QGP58653.1 Proline porter II [Piscirickettsia salmonis]QGP65079.1 Proline porter II [Piscirickettsia salmonis]
MRNFSNTSKAHSPVLISLIAGVEYYDFAILAILAPSLSRVFFPNLHLSIDPLFAIYAIGALCRPVGSIMWGHFADRYGRKKTLITTSFIMIFSTLCISILPNGHQAPIFSPIALLTLRCLQGVSLGGDASSAAVLIAETVSNKKRGFYVSFVFAMNSLGSLLAAAMAYLLLKITPANVMLEWGWRIPFVFGAFLLIICLIFRSGVLESTIFEKNPQRYRLPVSALFKHHSPQVFIGICLGFLGNSLVGLSFSFPTLATNQGFPTSQSSLAYTIATLYLTILYPIAGYFSDIIGRQRLLTIISILALISSIFIFQLMNIQTTLAITLFMIIIDTFMAITISSAQCAYSELFPTSVRVTGVGIVDSMSSSIGGMMPLLCNIAISLFHNNSAPAYILTIAASATCLAALMLHDQTGCPLTFDEHSTV